MKSISFCLTVIIILFNFTNLYSQTILKEVQLNLNNGSTLKADKIKTNDNKGLITAFLENGEKKIVKFSEVKDMKDPGGWTWGLYKKFPDQKKNFTECFMMKKLCFNGYTLVLYFTAAREYQEKVPFTASSDNQYWTKRMPETSQYFLFKGEEFVMEVMNYERIKLMKQYFSDSDFTKELIETFGEAEQMPKIVTNPNQFLNIEKDVAIQLNDKCNCN